MYKKYANTDVIKTERINIKDQNYVFINNLISTINIMAVYIEILNNFFKLKMIFDINKVFKNIFFTQISGE